MVSFIYVNKKLLNFAAASTTGALRIYKFSDTMELLHTFSPLSRAIVAIQAHPKNDSYFIAGCMDSKIRVYDQRKMELIYTFDLPDGISLFTFVTKAHFAVNLHNGETQLCRMNFPAKILLTSQ
jgi:WD40 repeat protein